SKAELKKKKKLKKAKKKSKKVKKKKAPKKKIKKIKKKIKKIKQEKVKKQKKLTLKGLKKDAYLTLNPIAELAKKYSKNGSIAIEGIQGFEIKKKASFKTAKRWAQEIKEYFQYWLKYWDVMPVSLHITAEEGISIAEHVKISFIQIKGFKEDKIAKEEIEAILKKLESKRGVSSGKDENFNRYVKVDSSQIFEYGTSNLKYGAAFILDSLVDIARIYKKYAEIKIQGYKGYTYKKGPGKKKAKKKSAKIAKYFKNKDIDKSRIIFLGTEGEHEKKRFVFTLYKKAVDASEVKSQLKEKAVKKKFEQVVVYSDSDSPLNSYSPSGWMGDVDDLNIKLAHTGHVHEAYHSIMVTYLARAAQGWSGIVWQYPNNNWGNMPGGRNLTGAKKLTFWAKGERGGEKIAKFRVGGIKGVYSDSDAAYISNVVLSKKWKKYEINLTDKDLSHIIGGFCFIVTKLDNRYGCTFYIDDVRFE
ncbi:hypothetical protein ACFL4O_02465, partial [bacterium]